MQPATDSRDKPATPNNAGDRLEYTVADAINDPEGPLGRIAEAVEAISEELPVLRREVTRVTDRLTDVVSALTGTINAEDAVAYARGEREIPRWSFPYLVARALAETGIGGCDCSATVEAIERGLSRVAEALEARDRPGPARPGPAAAPGPRRSGSTVGEVLGDS